MDKMNSNIHRRSFLKATAGAAIASPAFLRDLHAADGEIKVAGIHDASGGIDIYCRPMINSLTLAVEEINATGGLLGRPIKLINYDTQSNIQLYTQYATEAAVKEKVAVVQGGLTSASREAIRPLLRRYNTLYFYNTQYEGGVCDQNIFCTGATPAQKLATLVPHVVNKMGKKIYIVAADYIYGQLTAKWVAKYAAEAGGSVVAADFFPLDVTEFGPTITKIQAAKPDVVLAVLIGGAHMSFYRQWAASGMKTQIPMASTTFGGGNEHQVLTPQEGNGIVTSASYFPEIQSPKSLEFVKRYKQRFGENAPAQTELSAMTYHGMYLWAEGVKRAGSTDRQKVIKALEGGVTFDGPAGKSTIDPQTHHNTMDIYLGEARDQAFHVVQSFPQQPSSDTAAMCNLTTNPGDNQQYVISVK
jgi:urea transport system substrate-binding protein